MSAPASIEAEQAVLGAVLYDASECGEALERLRPEHFFDPVHRAIFEAVQAKARVGLAEPVGIAEQLKTHPGFVEMGGLGFLGDLIERASTWALSSHVDVIADRAARRAILALTTEVAAHAAATTEDSAEAVLAALERGAADIAREGSSKPQAVPVGMSAGEMLEAAARGDYVGTSVGLECLDKVTGGIRQDDVWFIGGRTSMGKSVMGLALARGIAEQGRGVMMFSLEMPMREVQARMISDLAYDVRIGEGTAAGGNVKYGDVLKGRLIPPQMDRARAAARALASLPVAVNDTGGLTIEDIRAQALRQMRSWEKAGVQRGAILIDHIGLVKPHKTRGGDSKAAETADVVNELKAIAKQVQAPVIALCQVNRATETRNDKRPTMADLNWSGAIEQIADFVCLLYRESYYAERETIRDSEKEVRVKYDIDLMVHKNRSGPICNIKAFVDIASNVIRDRDQPIRAYG